MDSKYQPQSVEDNIYRFWEKSGLIKSEKGRKFTVLMPPPNANASLHAGHGMYTVDDIMIRYKRLTGFASLWIPGVDHAGFETQYVYEKELAKKGKSRMDFDRLTLYDNIYNFVKENSGLIFNQFKKLGFLADWKRTIFTLDKHVVETVYETFKKMETEKYVYRDEYIVNYCIHCGTTLSELETHHIERKDPLYYIKYGPFVLATVRPETKFGDMALAVHPKDKRYQKWIGKEIEAEGLLGKFKLKVIADEMVDRSFGTGVVKITPAHDPNDFEVGKRHGLETKQVIDWNGKLNKSAGHYVGLKVKKAREIIVEDLKKKQLIEKIDENYTHSVAVCYKCGRDLEPMIIPNWFIKVKDLKKPVIEAIKKDKTKFFPRRFKKQILQWLEVMHDWPISRQIVWGIRIPVWYKIDKTASNIWVYWLDKNKKLQQGNVSQFLNRGVNLSEIEQGLQKVYALTGSSQPEYVVSIDKPKGDYLPETDTFDTWFSSGQWPLVTLKASEFKDRFPTDVMGTLSDILPFWVSRMMMFSLYLKQQVPFKNVYLWSMVADASGKKMSKSKGNVINPINMVNKYGADAFRTTLLFEVAPGGKVNLSEEKIVGMRNFINKVWNIGRFIWINKNPKSQTSNPKQIPNPKSQILNKLIKEFEKEKKEYFKYMEDYQFSKALGLIYEFLWHRFADFYIEQLKEDLQAGKIKTLDLLKKVYFDNLKMLHPFAPFVTEAIFQVFYGKEKSILKDSAT